MCVGLSLFVQGLFVLFLLNIIKKRVHRGLLNLPDSYVILKFVCFYGMLLQILLIVKSSGISIFDGCLYLHKRAKIHL